jgi:hypothetical protein
MRALSELMQINEESRVSDMFQMIGRKRRRVEMTLE